MQQVAVIPEPEEGFHHLVAAVLRWPPISPFELVALLEPGAAFSFVAEAFKDKERGTRLTCHAPSPGFQLLC